MKDLTVVIPAKDEAKSIVRVIKQVKALRLNYIIVVAKNDCHTISVIRDKKKIVYQKSKGFGDALSTGLKKIKTNYFSIIFADGSTNPKEIKNMKKYLNKTNSDFIFGSRYLPGASSDDDTIVTLIGNKIFTLLGKIFFKLKISDILYTYVVGKTKKFNKLNLKSRDFAICVELPIIASIKKMKITDYPCNERSRFSGKKKVNEFVDGFKILKKMFRLYFKMVW